ncbi:MULTISPECIES: quinone-dependent dihydroorotate dehydrogenase [Nocardia]|uniref:quinone-dependent dihydroorotate dehydrogenase n=1 Tax=Nocardia TaxID=1817 RepID=UPI0007EAEFDF|nr:MULTISPECIES: quinone-dependent dihydroorotate dehydrogenase [Nocardia]OBF66566.1 dihydroorotate dehydrogenase (quinone) [Mycobacterium sp. 852002-51759_SCH5129042]MBF6273347.1 quinone-dependent dihydroorotate dehydrogenase [Nocardia nova]OBA49398.1 dihydroorotate dehydrogenase (quinone) [Nocardia sp. 852002-51101_SCH5132738]OBB46205.1 dihydroorotate dehydrogenase (quinone) [Nocardia sp. 852002-51244_SCH5132740]PPJ00747.1 quinone-dependent dihydroorotate dehydrogenase [Nocardia nova]
MYSLFLRLLFLVPPERIHHLVFTVIRLTTAFPPTRWLARKLTAAGDPILSTTVFGVHFPAPLGLAAGFDKNAAGVNAWGALGFGFAEIGTVTAQAQPGNPAPRLFRLPADHALINRMGFNNHGAAAAAGRLAARRSGGVPIGANIGKTKVVEPEHAAEDYALSARLLGPLADFVVVNVSSPNTPGLRDLQAVESLRPLLRAVLDSVAAGAEPKPVLVKIAPDLSDEDIDAVADLAVELGLAGIVATNTTIRRDGLATPAAEVAAMGAGGLSGPPVADRSLEVLRRLYARVGDRLVLISVGGIENADQAYERILAGASLLQGYTGFIYGGLFWTRSVHRGIAARLRADGYRSLAEAVGAAHTARA